MEAGTIKYKKKGKIGKTEKGDLVIVNDDQKSYSVDQVVAMVWQMSDGIKSTDDIVDEISKNSKTDKEKIKEAIYQIIAKLEQSGLLEKA